MRIIGGAQRGRKILPPKDRSIRPALDRIREAIFSVVGDRVENARVLDLFAGVGAFGLESLSRGARSVHFVDASRKSIEILRQNVRQFGYEAFSTVDCSDALSTPVLEDTASYDLVFLDPPFPFFKKPNDVTAVFDRVGQLVDACEGVVVVLRQPAWYRGDPPFEARDTRRYGESRVLFFG